MRAVAAIVALLGLAAPAAAATFEAERLTDGRIALHMRGVIHRGDEEMLAAEMRRQPEAALLLLDSTGGDAWSSLEIGRINTLPVEVRTGEVCASGCAMIWASAHDRYIEPAASVGFHQISQTIDGRLVPVAWATAVVATRYRQLGFSEEAIRRMTSAPPGEMHWVSDMDAAFGIAFAPRATTRGTLIAEAPIFDPTDVSALLGQPAGTPSN